MISSDLVGTLELSPKHVQRKIFPASREMMHAVYSICERERFFDQSIIPTTIVPDAEHLIFEHEQVPFVTFPYEWSSLMYRDCGLCLLDLMERLSPHNLYLSDIHPFNLTFYKGKWCFLDFSAIHQGQVDKHLLREFIRHYINPVALCAKGQWQKVSALLNYSKVKIRHTDVMGYLSLIEKAEYLAYYLRLKAALKSRNRLSAIRTLKDWLLSYDLSKNRQGWGDYYKIDLLSSVGDPSSWRSKQRMLERLLAEYKPKRVLDIAGNGGLFSFHAAQKGIETICLDNENEAINRCYQVVKDHGMQTITPAVVDFIAPSLSRIHAPVSNSAIKSPYLSLRERIGDTDISMMLALVHHLVFSQNLTFSEIIDQAASFGSQYLWIELPTQKSKSVQTWLEQDQMGRFAWYNEENFVRALEKTYTILSREELEGEERFHTRDGDTVFFFCQRKS